jgi:hypothetical protein
MPDSRRPVLTGPARDRLTHKRRVPHRSTATRQGRSGTWETHMDGDLR